MHARESQDCYKGDSGEDSERKEENSRESFYLLRKCINYYEQNIGRRWVKAILVKSQMELINNHWMRRKGGKCYTIV